MRHHLIVASILGIVFPADASEPDLEKFTPTAILYGSHSGITDRQIFFVTNEDDWNRVWTDHRSGGEKYTETRQHIGIDFEKQFIVAIFTGRKNSHEYLYATVHRGKNELVVRFGDELVSTEGIRFPNPNPGCGPERLKEFELARKKRNAEASYAFVILPKPVTRIVVEEECFTSRKDPPRRKVVTTYVGSDSSK